MSSNNKSELQLKLISNGKIDNCLVCWTPQNNLKLLLKSEVSTCDLLLLGTIEIGIYNL